MRKETLVQVAHCRTCQLFNPGPRARPPVKPIPVGGPFHRIGIDLVGPLPPSRRANRYILVVTDYLTRAVETAALADKSAQSVARFIFNMILCRHGCPEIILSDNGTEFCNEIMESLAKVNSIVRRFSAPYHPRCNGLTERVNKTLSTRLAKLVYSTGLNWDDLLPAATFAYMITRNRIMGLSPFEALYGRPALISTKAFDACSSSRDVAEAAKRTQMIQGSLKLYIESQQSAQATPESENLRLELDDLVLVRVPKKDKLMPTWKGPAVIKRVYRHDAYEVHFLEDGRVRKASRADLRHFKDDHALEDLDCPEPEEMPLISEGRDVAARALRPE
jgi:hypothetical protein